MSASDRLATAEAIIRDVPLRDLDDALIDRICAFNAGVAAPAPERLCETCWKAAGWAPTCISAGKRTCSGCARTTTVYLPAAPSATAERAMAVRPLMEKIASGNLSVAPALEAAWEAGRLFGRAER